MAKFKKNDVVFADDVNSKMTVSNVNGHDVYCAGLLEPFDEDDLTLFARSNITASQVKNGIESSFEVHLRKPLSEKIIGYGKIYDYDEQLWLLDDKDNVYPARCDGENEYTAFSSSGDIFATSEENDIIRKDKE